MNLRTDPFRLPGAAASQALASPEIHTLLECEVFPGYLARCRWFGGKAREPRQFRISEWATLAAARLAFVEVTYADGSAETYLLPLQCAGGEQAARLEKEGPSAVVARFRDGGVLFDAVHDAEFRAALFTIIARGELAGELLGVPGNGLPQNAPESRVLAVEQSNTAIIYGDSVFLKLYRRLEEGVNPDAEILRHLGARGFPHVPPFRGTLELRRAGRGPLLLALATGMIANDGDAWSFTLRELARQLTCVRAGDLREAERIETAYLARAVQLGERTGALHRALAADGADADFAPEPLAAEDFEELAETTRTTLAQVLAQLRIRLGELDPATRELASGVLAGEPTLRTRIAALGGQSFAAAKTRTHGDYHLGQVLNAGGDFVIMDFEGEPAKPLAERRRKRSPLRDVAGMLRSFHYAAHSALAEFPEHRADLEPHAGRWHERVREAFLGAWVAATAGAAFVPAECADRSRLLGDFVLEKALYEVAYELNNRPAWLGIPLRGVAQILRAAP